MNFLFLYTHQTWPMHYFHGGVMARALVNEGHTVTWFNCERTMFGCHAQWIVPSMPPDDICTACVQRGSWLDDMGVPHEPMSAYLTDADRADAAGIRQMTDVHALFALRDGDVPIGECALSSPVSAFRMISIDDPVPGFLERYRDAVASALLVNRAVTRFMEQHPVDRVVMHLGRLLPEQVMIHHVERRGLPWFVWETGPVRNSMALYKDANVYNFRYLQGRWKAFADAPLSVDEIATVQHLLFLRRKDRRKSGMYTYSPTQTSARVMFEQLGLAPTRKLAAVFTSSVDEVNVLSSMLDPNWTRRYPDQYAFVREALDWARANPDWSLVVRIHPNEGARANHLGMKGTQSLELYQRMLTPEVVPPNARIVWPDDQISSYTLMETAAVGLVWASTTGTEMTCMGRPVVIVDNPLYRVANFTWLCDGPGHLGEAIEIAVASTPEERLENAIRAQRFAYHQLARYALPFPLVVDHGRMERISLDFGRPEDLVRGRFPALDKVLDYLVRDVSPFPEAPTTDAADARWERAAMARLIAPEFRLDERSPLPESLPDAVAFAAAAAGRGLHPDEREGTFADLTRLLRTTRPDGPIITFGPVGPLLKVMAPARSHVLVDHRDADVIDADVGGRPSQLPLRPRSAAAVVLHGLSGADPRVDLAAARDALTPGGQMLVLAVPGICPAALEPTQVGLRQLLEETGLTGVVVRPAGGGGFVGCGRVPGTAEAAGPLLARRDPLSQVLPPVRRDADKISTPDGKTVLLVRRGEAYSAWPEDLDAAQPVPDYYRFDRPEVRRLVPPTAKRVLDVGCAGGGLGAALKKERPSLVVDGIEVVPHAARMADQVLDEVFVGPVEQVHPRLTDGAYDCIVFADVLEHTVDPVGVLRLLRPKLKADGVLVVSLPNIRHWTVLGPLIEGKFDYEDAGILDRTHLRFFTKQTMVELFHHNGFDVTQVLKVDFGGEAPPALVDALKQTGLAVDTLQDESGAYQYLLVCQRRPEPRERLTSVILLAWNQLAYTKLCIESVIRHTHVPYELVLVDNGSHDGTPEYFREVRSRHPNVKIILNRKNLGFAKGCNQGLAAANGDYVCFLNNDTLVTEGWLDRLQWYAELEPHVGIVGPVSNRVAGIQRVTPVAYDEDAMTPEGIARMEQFAAGYRAAHRDESTFVNRIIGLCLLLKREVIERIGGFDTRYGTGNFEDDDLCFRARVAGYKVIIARDVFIHHYGSKTFEGNNVDYSATMDRNMERFLKKWGFERSEGGYKATGLDQIVYDRAKHFAPFSPEEGFRSDTRPVTLENPRARTVLIVPPWGEDEALTALLRTLAGLDAEADVAVLVRCPPYEGKSYLASLERLAAAARLTVKADVRLVDAPLAPDREAGLYLAASALYVDESWPDADLVVRRAADCGVPVLRGPDELVAFLK